MKSIWLLEDVNLFDILCPHKFENFKSSHEFHNYRKSDYIYFQQDASRNLYLVEKGKVKVGYYNDDGTEVIKAILTKGDLFGEKVIFGEIKRDEFAQSLDNKTSICPIAVDKLYALMKENESFSLKIYKFIGFKYRKLERRLQLLLFKDSMARLKEFINELSSEYGYSCDVSGHCIIKHPYTQKDIASLIGVSRPTLNILLNDLRKSKTLDFSRREIKLFKKIA